MYTKEEEEVIRLIWANNITSSKQLLQLDTAIVPNWLAQRAKGEDYAAETVEDFLRLILNRTKKSIISKLAQLGLRVRNRQKREKSLKKCEIVKKIQKLTGINEYKLIGLDKASKQSLLHLLEYLEQL